MIYNIYKPKDFSSFSIVKKIKYITKEKVGHSGTLDPFADGVLVLGVGKSTKKLSSIIQYDKTYEGVIRLGIQTDSMDLTGTVVAEEKIPVITSTMLDRCANSFVGELLQRTPMFSRWTPSSSRSARAPCSVSCAEPWRRRSEPRSQRGSGDAA